MALTFSKTLKFVAGDRKIWIGDVTFDSSYPAGGESVSKADFGFDNVINAVLPVGVARKGATHDTAFAVSFDASASKLVAFASDDNNAADSPLLELSGLSTPITDASSYVQTVIVVGK